MASQTQGIQQLLTAEKRAAEKVAEARKRKYSTNYCLSPKFPIFFFNSQNTIRKAVDVFLSSYIKYDINCLVFIEQK